MSSGEKTYQYSDKEVLFLVEMVQSYKAQRELIVKLQADLEQVKLAGAQAEQERLAVAEELRQLKEITESLRQSMVDLQLAQQKKDVLYENEIKRLKKSRWKWALTAGAIGVVTGMVLGLVGSK